MIEDGSEGRKAKDTNKCVVKRKFEYKDFKNCLKTTQLENEINHLEKKTIMNSLKKIIKNSLRKLINIDATKSEMHNVFTEEFNKIASCLNDDKRVQ